MPGLPQRNHPVLTTASTLIARLREQGHDALVAGGCVRDCLLGREPKDADLATSATPDQVAAVFPHAKPIGRAFGVMLVHEAGLDFEIATYRRDSAYTDGRHPDTVVFTNAREDALRRDFTINGMFYDPIEDRVIDHVGGLDDLAARRIRAIGHPQQRFREDALRLLRAVRFAATLGFQIDPATEEAMRASAPDIRRVSAERIAGELTRMLTESMRPGDAIALLHRCALLREILPEVADLDGVEQPPEFHPEGDVLVHTILVLNHLEHPSPELAYAALLHDIGKKPTQTRVRLEDGSERIRFENHASVGARMAESILHRLRHSNHLTEQVVTCVAQHMKFIDIRNMRPARRMRWIASPLFPVELELHRADCLGSNGDLSNYTFALAELEAMRAKPPLPPRLLKGDDVVAEGVARGPRIAALLAESFEAQLEGAFTSREEARQWLRTRLARGDT